MIRPLFCAVAIATTALPVAAVDRAALVAEFLFENGLVNSATGVAVLNQTSALLINDRFGRPSSALRVAPNGFVGSSTVDYVKNQRHWSWSGWVRSDDSSLVEPQAIYSEGNRGVSFSIYFQDGSLKVSTWNESINGNWTTLSTIPIVIPRKWHHIAVTFDSNDGLLGNCTLYFDGQSAISGNLGYVKASGYRAESHDFAFLDNVGAMNGGDVRRPFQGAIDDVLIYHRVLTPAEVKELTNLPPPPDRLYFYPAIELELVMTQGKTYQIQSSADLITWTNDGNPVTGNGESFRRLVSTRDGVQTYWRMVPVNTP